MNVAQYANTPSYAARPSTFAGFRGQAGKADLALDEAHALMEKHGIPLENHSACAENLATYLSHRSFGKISGRWQHKIDRELKNPCTDKQVAERIDHLQTSLLENLAEYPQMPSKLYITGSFARGRLGGNSDLDGYALLKDEHVAAGFDSYEKRVNVQDACCLFPMAESRPGYNRANLMMVGGASVAIDPANLKQPGFLRSVYEDVKANRKSRRETSGVYEWITSKAWKEDLSPADKRKSFEGRTMKSQLTNAAMAFCGTLAGLPLIGAVVRWGANTCVKQNHSENF